jgi:integrase
VRGEAPPQAGPSYPTDGPAQAPVGGASVYSFSADRSLKRAKRAAAAAGLDPARYAGHSLRAGLATAAAQAGVSERVIMQQTGHRSVAMVRRYIRDGSLFRDNAAAAVGV